MIRMNMVIGIIILMLTNLSFSTLAIELRTAAQDSAPKYFKNKDNIMSGICVDIISKIEVTEPQIRFNGYQEFLPFKRLQNYLENGQLDAFCGLKKTAIRNQKYLFIDIPLYQLNYVVAVRMDDKVKINSLGDIRSLGKKGRVITIFGTAASKFLKKKSGILIDDNAYSPSTLLKMLINKRGRFAFYHDLGLQYNIKKDNLEKLVKIIPVSFSKYSHHIAFSKKTPLETIDKVRVALKTLKANGGLSRIHRKYNLLK